MAATQQLKKHLVFGAGQIGGFLAGCVSAQGFDVALVARPKLAARYALPMACSDLDGHSATIDGLRCVSTEQGRESTAEQFDVIWLTVKCVSVQAALAELQSFVGDNTLILCCQNGLGADRLVREAFPSNVVLRVMVPFNVVDLNAEETEAKAATGGDYDVQTQGLRWYRATEGTLSVEKHPAVVALVERVNSELMPVVCVEDMDAALWAKLQLNLANPVNTLADLPIKTMLENRDYRKLLATAMGELLAVTRAMDLSLPKLTRIPAHWIPYVLRLPNWLFTRVAQQMLAIDPEARVSMWWDIQQGRLTEIEYLNGAVVEKAQALGLPCPVNQQLVEKIHQLEQGKKVSLL